MYLKVSDTTSATPQSVTLEETFIKHVDYRKNPSGAIMVSVVRVLGTTDTDTLEKRTGFSFQVADVQLDVLSGGTIIKTFRGAPTGFSVHTVVDDHGHKNLIERIDYLVGGHISNGHVH